MNALDIITQLRKTNKKGVKESIIENAIGQCDEFFEGVELAYNPKYKFSFKDVPFIEDADLIEDPGDPKNFTFSDFKNILKGYLDNKFTHEETVKKFEKAAEIANVHEWNLWYRCILLRNLKCGIQKKTVDNLLGRITDTDRILDMLKPDVVENKDLPEMDVGGINLDILFNVSNYVAMMPFEIPMPKKFETNIFIDPIISEQRILIKIDKKAKTVRCFDVAGNSLSFKNIELAFLKILEMIPASIVLDGYMINKSLYEFMEPTTVDKTYYAIMDVLTLQEFNLKASRMPLWKRHASLVKMLPMIKEIKDCPFYIIPKLKLENVSDVDIVIDEIKYAGYNGFIIKKAESGYTAGLDAYQNWCSVKLS
jgi:hypothetical protein